MNYYFFSFLDAIKNLPDPSKQKTTNANRGIPRMDLNEIYIPKTALHSTPRKFSPICCALLL